MTIQEVVAAFEVAEQAAQYLYQDQHDGTWNTVGETYNAGKESFKNAKNVAQAEKVRQQYERLTKGIESALKRARLIADAETRLKQHEEQRGLKESAKTVHGVLVTA